MFFVIQYHHGIGSAPNFESNGNGENGTMVAGGGVHTDGNGKDLKRFYYRPQRSWGKVMFLHVWVILFTGGVLSQHALQQVSGGVLSQHALQMVSQHALQQVSRGSAPRKGLLGGCLVDTPGTATAAGGTHPTGMHSCLICPRSVNEPLLPSRHVQIK